MSETYQGPERRGGDDVTRRLEQLEKMVDNGRFVRTDYFKAIVEGLRDDLVRLSNDLALARAAQAKDQEARENDRRGIRNLVIAAVMSAGFSLIVSLVLIGLSRGSPS